jgi:hypothetical protein
MCLIFVVFAIICVGARPAAAGEKAGVKLPDAMEIAGKHLTLNGMGLREATWLKIDVYVAGLYLETVSSDAPAIVRSNQVKRLVLRFVRDVDRSDILEAWHDGFKANATVKLAAIQPLIDQLDRWMVDFSDGDTLAFTDVPGEGIHVEINGARKGVLKGDDFARSLFSIWLGPKPPTTALKTGLLGKHPAPAAR